MREIHPALAVLASALVAGAVTGCGVFKSSTSQASSESSSNSSGTSSKSSTSSSNSSGGEGAPESDTQAYERDIRDATARSAASGTPNVPSLEKSVGTIAESYGITDWEQDRHTYVGIGRGLAKAGVGEPALAQVTAELAHTDPRCREWIRSGYDAAP